MKALLVALVLANGADATTTALALARGAHEHNPLMPSTTAGIVAVKAIGTAGEVVALKWWSREHPDSARAVAISAIGVYAGAAGVNVRVAFSVGGRP